MKDAHKEKFGIDEVDQIHEISLEVHGIHDVKKAKEFVSQLLRLPDDPSKVAENLFAEATDKGVLVQVPPICCVYNPTRYGFVWNNICEIRDVGCPA